MSLNIQNAQFINDKYFSYYSNGGYGNLPNPVYDDMITTDQYVARRYEAPSLAGRTYYTDYKNSPFYSNDQNRKLTMTEQVSSLQQKGVKLVGQEAFGKYSVYASLPDSSGYLQSYNTTTEYHQFLWILLGVGILAFVVNVMTPTS
jgi:hypothetical protein